MSDSYNQFFCYCSYLSLQRYICFFILWLRICMKRILICMILPIYFFVFSKKCIIFAIKSYNFVIFVVCLTLKASLISLSPMLTCVKWPDSKVMCSKTTILVSSWTVAPLTVLSCMQETLLRQIDGAWKGQSYSSDRAVIVLVVAVFIYLPAFSCYSL